MNTYVIAHISVERTQSTEADMERILVHATLNLTTEGFARPTNVAVQRNLD